MAYTEIPKVGAGLSWFCGNYLENFHLTSELRKALTSKFWKSGNL